MDDKTIDTIIDIAGRWESLDPSKGLKNTYLFIRQGQKDISFLLSMIESRDAEIEALTGDIEDLRMELRECHEDL